MRLLALPTSLILFTLSTNTIGASVGEYVQHGFVIPHPDEVPPVAPEPEPVVPAVSPGQDRGPYDNDGTPAYGDPAEVGGLTSGSGGLEGGLGSEPSLSDIPYEPASSPNPCFGSEDCGEVTQEIAEEVMEKLGDLVQNLIPGPSSSAVASTIPLATGSAVVTTTTGTPTTTATTRAAIYPNADLARSVISTGLSQPYMALLDRDEQELYVQDPVCFFANVVRMYSTAASAPVTPTSTSTPTPATRRRRQEGSSTLTPTATPALQSAFFVTALPRQIWSVYTPQNGTSSASIYGTTCTAFDGEETYATSYVQRSAPSPTNAAAPATEVTGAATGTKAASGLVVAIGGVVVGMATVLL